MSEWKKVKFLDFIVLQRGFDLTKDSIKDGPYPVVCSTSIMGYHNNYKVEGPGVVTGRSGTLGETQYVKDNFWPHNTTLFVKDFKGNNRQFVYYFLKNFDIASMGGGAAIPSLNRNVLSNLSVTIPDLSIQNNIATILSRYDSLIENYQKQIKLLEEAAQRLYKEWFIDLRFPGYENTKIVDGVPEGWEKKCIAELGSVITGKTPSTSKRENYGGSIPFITIPDMHTGIFPVSSQFLSDIGANSQKGKFIPADSLMVSCIGTAGLVCISSTPCQTNQQINSLILHDKRFLYFLYYAFLMLKEHLNNIGSNGATMTNVNKSKFESISLLIPTGTLISSYNDKANPFFKNIKLLSSQIRLLTEARDRLLPKLMSGEIAV